MNKKVFVIEDVDKFIDEFCSYLPLVDKPSSIEREKLRAFLKDYKEDVIGFEGMVETETTAESIPDGDFATPKKIVGIPSGFADGTKLKVFAIVKPKKPEGEDEKDKT